MSRPSIYESDDFLLWGIQRAAERAFGQTVSLVPDDRLGDIVKLSHWNNDNWEDFCTALDCNFGISPDPVALYPREFGTSLKTWYGELQQNVRIRDLMDWIRQEAFPISFAPLSLPGAPGTEAAGWFLGIQQIVEPMVHKGYRIAPSHRIGDFLRGGQLMDFWERMHLYSYGQISVSPSQTYTWGTAIIIVGVISLISAIYLELQQMGQGWLLAGLLWGCKLLGLGSWLQRLVVPRPLGIDTFADLSRYLAEHVPSQMVAR